MKEIITEKTFVTILTVAAVALVVMGAAVLVGWRKRPGGTRTGVMLAAAGPLLWLLWLVYGGIVQHFGLDSVKGLILNIAIFVIAGAVIGILLGLWQRKQQASQQDNHKQSTQ
jgi:hypothetical protein